MKVVSDIKPLRDQVAAWRAGGRSIGFVPTMGSLHAGHLALVTRAREMADVTAVSIFVNPMQFGPGEDYDAYPRTPDADRDRLLQAGADLLFTPAAGVMYPRELERQTRVTVPELGDMLEGESRPGFFTGVATVVARLLNLVQPDVAVFGEKDYQQLAVIRRMVEDLQMPVRIEGHATVREDDGLAMSSRNAYLSAEERRAAPALYRSLQGAGAALRAGRAAAEVEGEALAELCAAGFEPDYFCVRRASDLSPPGKGDGQLVILAAARLGRTRLIDNLVVRL